MSLTRREFLGRAAAVTGGLGMPAFFRRVARAAPPPDQPGARDTVLVVIELNGGNDGLNTVIPYRDPEYARARPTLKQPSAAIRRITGQLGFHPALQGFSELLDQSRLAIVQGVGYPDPNRSHFESMDIWHRATQAKSERYGWLGRALPLASDAAALHVGGRSPLALFGAAGHAPALDSLAEYQLQLGPPEESARKLATLQRLAASQPDAGTDPLLDAARQAARRTYASADRLGRIAREYDTPVAWPETRLAQRLKLIAQLIEAGVPERVYFTSLGGFDTHAVQQETHARLLGELSDALAAFDQDLVHHGHGERVLVMTFSEFGRRVRENGSQGTDHGVASPMFLVGGRVKAGLIGDHPSLTDLDSGDLKFHTDFRSVYAAVLDDWLGVPADNVLERRFPRLELFQPA